MSLTDYTTSLLDLEYAEIENIEQQPNTIIVSFHMKKRPHFCPHCHTLTDTVHDYRIQYVKDLPVLGRHLLWKYKKRRYHCSCCGKHFIESNHLLPKWHRITSRLALYSFSLLGEKRSVSDVAHSLNVSSTTLFRWLNLLSFPKPNGLPEVLSIDEFKGNTGSQKFQCILTDPIHKKIVDILPSRTQSQLSDYFRSFPLAKSKNVRFFVSDMNRIYTDLAGQFFPNAKIVIDKFHVARYCSWAVENVRKNVQKMLPDHTRKYFKKSRKLLLMPMEKLKDDQKEKVSIMLSYSEELRNAYLLKEYFHSFMKSEDKQEAKERLRWFRVLASNYRLQEFNRCLRVLENWEPYILNAFDSHLSNGFTEGINNSIKVIKRTGYGYRNFNHFRNRILLIHNN